MVLRLSNNHCEQNLPKYQVFCHLHSTCRWSLVHLFSTNLYLFLHLLLHTIISNNRRLILQDIQLCFPFPTSIRYTQYRFVSPYRQRFHIPNFLRLSSNHRQLYILILLPQNLYPHYSVPTKYRHPKSHRILYCHF